MTTQFIDDLCKRAAVFSNLRKRAKALGLIITKATTAQDAREFGEHRYVLHTEQDNWEHMEMFSLWGIRSLIEEKEASK